MSKEIDIVNIENIVNNLTDRYNLDNRVEDGYIDVIEIAKDNGFIVANAKLSDDSDGFIVIDENVGELFGLPTSKLIAVNSNRSLEWKRFIIAHELGHYFLHYVNNASTHNGIYAVREHKNEIDKTKKEVDYFSSSLLLPKRIFSKRFNELKEKGVGNIELVLSKEFIVTQIMTERRIKELGL